VGAGGREEFVARVVGFECFLAALVRGLLLVEVDPRRLGEGFPQRLFGGGGGAEAVGHVQRLKHALPNRVVRRGLWPAEHDRREVVRFEDGRGEVGGVVQHLKVREVFETGEGAALDGGLVDGVGDDPDLDGAGVPSDHAAVGVGLGDGATLKGGAAGPPALLAGALGRHRGSWPGVPEADDDGFDAVVLFEVDGLGFGVNHGDGDGDSSVIVSGSVSTTSGEPA